MSIRAAIGTIIASTLLLAGLGAGAGYLLGAFVPGYYRAGFLGGRAPDFDPVSIGIGQGLTQGMAGGVVVGVALVAILCWRQTRLERVPDTASAPGKSLLADWPITRALLLTTGGMLTLGLCVCSGRGLIFLGELRGVAISGHDRYREERRVLTPVLSGDSAYAEVEIHEASWGAAILSGTVSTAADLERLRTRVERAIGAHRAKDAMQGVQVKE